MHNDSIMSMNINAGMQYVMFRSVYLIEVHAYLHICGFCTKSNFNISGCILHMCVLINQCTQ